MRSKPSSPPPSPIPLAHQDVMSIRELSTYLQIPVSTAYGLAAQGRLPGLKVGRHWRFYRPTVERWLQEGLHAPEPLLLVVDDDETIGELFKAYGRRTGFRVIAVTHGRDAAAWVDRAPITAVFLDLLLPDMDGVAVFQQIREKRSDLPVVIITGHAEAALLERALTLGPFLVMKKPFARQELLDVLKRLHPSG